MEKLKQIGLLHVKLHVKFHTHPILDCINNTHILYIKKPVISDRF